MRENNQTQEELLSELAILKQRAIKVGYKNIIPRLPKSFYIGHSEHLMQGFQKRLTNWKNYLIQLENPGGIPYGEKTAKVVLSSKEDMMKRLSEQLGASLINEHP